MAYYLRIYDNFHEMEEDEFDESRLFDSLQEALLEAQHTVKNSVLHLWSTGKNVDELVGAWLDFGDNTVVCSTDSTIKAPSFSGGEYASEVVEKLKESLFSERKPIQTVYQETILFAAEKHALINQMVPGTQIPYVVHLANVSMEVMMAAQETTNFNVRLAIQAALLHDTLEDTDTTKKELEERFGMAVPVCVKALTKDSKLPKDQQMGDSLSRIKKLPYEIWAVKMADRITNLQAPPAHWSHEKKINYLEEANVILHELKASNEYLAIRLEKKMEEYQAYITR